jgi:hypothetical protein
MPTAVEGAGDLAPSFEEIQAEAQRITGGNPEYTTEQWQQLKQYSKSLEGKRIEGWVGWVSTVSPDRNFYLSLSNPIDPYPFEVWIRMYSSVSEPSTPPFDQVILNDATLEQVEKLSAFTSPLMDTLDLSVPLQKVVFSGTMFDVEAPYFIYVKHAQVQPAEQP